MEGVILVIALTIIGAAIGSIGYMVVKSWRENN